MTVDKIDDSLFSEIKIGRMALSHRISSAPLTRLRATFDNVPSQLMMDYYDERTRVQGSFVVAEDSPISDKFGSIHHQPGAWNERQFHNWALIVEKVHFNKSYIFLQLGGHCKVQPLCHYVTARWQSDNWINDYESAYVLAAFRALQIAKFDGVEISVSHYIQSLVKEGINDGNRVKLIERFADFLKSKLLPEIGPENIDRIGLKIAFFSVAEQIQLLASFDKLGLQGLAYLTVSEPRLTNQHAESESALTSNDWIFDHWPGKIIRVGGYLDDIAKLNRDILSQSRTVIGVGKYYSSNPLLVDKLRSGEHLVPYNRPTFYTNTSYGYSELQVHPHHDSSQLERSPIALDEYVTTSKPALQAGSA